MSGELQHRLRKLRENFANQLPEKLQSLEHHWIELKNSGWQPESLDALQSLCHKLAGSCGSFGFSQLGVQARLMEVSLDLYDNVQPSEEQMAALEYIYEEIQKAAKIEAEALMISARKTESLKPLALRPVYVVDDDPMQCEFVATCLSESGYEVITCSNLERLEVMIEDRQPGAIIMDLSFPQGPMAGSDLIARIKNKQLLQVPVIFISGHNSMRSRLQAVRAGGDAYFPKPVKSDELVASLDYLVAKGHAEPYRVLIIDDDASLGEYHAELLRRAGLQVKVLTRPLEVLEFILDFRPELLLMDLHMPECSGIELANLLRQHDAYVNLPIVFLSAEEDARKHFEARLVGADDFLIKPIAEEFLIAAVVNRVQRARSAEQLMTTDSMTGLLNHETVLSELERQLLLAQRENTNTSVCMVDLDHFKRVNDTYGHIVGDSVIKSFSDLLKERLRRTDLIGRYGGEEFAVVLPDTGAKEAQAKLDEIRQSFSEVRHYCEDEVFQVTVSGGVAQVSDYKESQALLQAADEALYKAKHQGRNRIEIADPAG